MKEFWNMIQMVFAGVGGWLGYFLGGNDGLLIALVLVRFVSAVVFSGVVCKFAADGLARTGVLKSYALGAKTDVGKVYDEE